MLRVGDSKKLVAVLGDRVWRGSNPTPPQPFVSIPLVYERAYGGSYTAGERLFCEERNPVGVGFLGKRSKSDLAGQPHAGGLFRACPGVAGVDAFEFRDQQSPSLRLEDPEVFAQLFGVLCLARHQGHLKSRTSFFVIAGGTLRTR